LPRSTIYFRTSQGRIRSIVKMADQSWTCDRIKGGLSSGGGFIEAVRDPVERYDAKEKRFEVVDPGYTAQKDARRQACHAIDGSLMLDQNASSLPIGSIVTPRFDPCLPKT
jgi:hypothetical protein